MILASPYGDKTADNYLNPAAFAMPADGTFANTGRSSILAPGNWQFDISLTRTFQITEAQRIELRAEAFNLTNSTKFRAPETNWSRGNFGTISQAEDPRIMQFALKYYF